MAMSRARQLFLTHFDSVWALTQIMTTFGIRLMELFDMIGRVAIISGGKDLLGLCYGEGFAACRCGRPK
jgi:hypothetical protein